MHCICRNRAHLSMLHRMMVDAGFSPSVIQRYICRIGSGASRALCCACACCCRLCLELAVARAGEGAATAQARSSRGGPPSRRWAGRHHRAITKQRGRPPLHELGRVPLPCEHQAGGSTAVARTGEGAAMRLIEDAAALFSCFLYDWRRNGGCRCAPFSLSLSLFSLVRRAYRLNAGLNYWREER
jgi:hypothetical protein